MNDRRCTKYGRVLHFCIVSGASANPSEWYPVAGIAEQEHIMHLVPSPNVVRALCNQNPNIVVVEMKNNRNRFMLRLPLQIEPILQALNEYPSGRQ